MERRRHPLNAPGPFYASDGDCISCGAPEAEAPTLIASDDAGCYFKRQPETADEVNQALSAMFVGCVKAHRYAGEDKPMLKRLAEMDLADCCDHPSDHAPVIRNHVRFAVDTADAREIARQLLSQLMKGSQDFGRCVAPVSGDAQRAQFEHDSYARPITYVVAHVSPWQRTGSSSFQRSPKHLWLLATDDTKYTPLGLQSLLIAIGARSLRWFSADEWRKGGEGQELPF